jgi:hypothetical protein
MFTCIRVLSGVCRRISLDRNTTVSFPFHAVLFPCLHGSADTCPYIRLHFTCTGIFASPITCSLIPISPQHHINSHHIQSSHHPSSLFPRIPTLTSIVVHQCRKSFKSATMFIGLLRLKCSFPNSRQGPPVQRGAHATEAAGLPCSMPQHVM